MIYRLVIFPKLYLSGCFLFVGFSWQCGICKFLLNWNENRAVTQSHTMFCFFRLKIQNRPRS